MNKLFSEEEKRKIFDQSLWQKELSSIGVSTPSYDDFAARLDNFCNAFPMTIEDGYLFGKGKKPETYDCEAMPFAIFVANEIERSCNSTVLMEGAFSEWTESVTEFLFQIFGLMAYDELEASVGEITLPCDEWVANKALPYVLSGQQFRNMALKYPIYARQVIDFIYSQIEHIKEIIDAVNDELPEFYSYFFDEDNDNTFKVAKVSASSSDKHNGGRCVHLITFENGNRLVYKPREFGVDRAFNKWLRWCSKTAGLDEPYVLKMKDCKRGGFCEFASPKELEREEDIAPSFERLGFLLGCVYILKGSDLHSENIIVSGSEPVIIDMETLLAPKGCLVDKLSLGEKVYSVNDMAVLPMMGLGPGMAEVKYASLCYVMKGASNLPKWKGEYVSGSSYSSSISKGFIMALHTVCDHKEEAGKVLKDCFLGKRFRCVLKATSFYCSLIFALGNKDYQKDVNAYLAIVKHTRINSNKIDKDIIDYILSHEAMAYDRLDVPYFTDVLSEYMLDQLILFWNDFDEDKINNEALKIEFALDYHRADEKTGEASRMKTEGLSDAKIREKAGQQADSLCRLLNKELSSLIMPRDQDKYIIYGDATRFDSFLDAGLGVVIALVSYMKAFDQGIESCEEIIQAVQKKVRKLTEPSGCAASLTGKSLGLADGTAGYLCATICCYRLGIITKEELKSIIANIGRLAEKKSVFSLVQVSAFYGCLDMILAISCIPEEFMTDEMSRLREMNMDRIRESKEYGNLSEEEIIKISKDEAIKHCEAPSISMNNSLRFGNAAALYHMAGKKNQMTAEEVSIADRLLAHLCQQSHILEGISYPSDCIENGIFHGMPGVLYAISRYYAPDKVPELF